MSKQPLKVAWISYFPIEWLPNLPEPLRKLPRRHPATWQRVLLEQFERDLADLRLHIVVVRRAFPRDFSFERNGVTFHCLKSPPGWRRVSLFWVDTFLIRRCLGNIKPDVVHAWGTEDGAAAVATRLGYPYLVTIQGLLQWYVQIMSMPWYMHLSVFLEKRCLRHCRLVSAESSFTVSYLKERYPNLQLRHVDVVPSPLFHTIKRQPENTPPHFLFVGELGHRKGGDLLLGSLANLDSDFALSVVGVKEPGFFEKFPERLRHKVQFKHGLNSAEIAAELGRATLMVCPTRADTGPMAAKEAALAGVPVVGSAVGGIPDYIVPGENGLLFPSGDLQACSQAVRNAVTHPLFGRGLVDPRRLAAVREQLSPERMARSFAALYRECHENAMHSK